jgi:hypothetical protein
MTHGSTPRPPRVPRRYVFGGRFVLGLLVLTGGAVSGQEPAPSATPTQPADAPPSAEVLAFLAEWSEAMRDVRSLRVRFKQTKRLRILRRPLVREGETLLVGRTVLMVTRDKRGKVETELLVTPSEARLHHPRLKRLEVFPITPGAAPPTPFPLFGSDLEDLPTRYRLSLELHPSKEGRAEGEQTEDERTLVLVPRDPKSPLAETRMRFRGTRILQVAQRSRRGDSVQIDVTRFERNVEIERKLELKIAPGTKVSRLGG